jgi:enolase
MFVKEVSAKEIKDSRGEPTIEIVVNDCSASSPAGKSTGKYETPCYLKSLSWNILAINKLKELKDVEINSFSDLKKVESIIKKKFKLRDVKQFGANALFALESAILKALAKSRGIELWQLINASAQRVPLPLGNVIGGGLHSHNDNHPAFQEFLLIPKAKSFKKQYYKMKGLYGKLKLIVRAVGMNDEGALECALSEERILEILSVFRKYADFGVDIASSSFYSKGSYVYGNKVLDRNTQIHFINDIIEKFHPKYIEDPLNEEDFLGFSKISKDTMVCGDDLTVTHIGRLRRAIKNKSINAMIVKPNQNGSLLEVKRVCDLCKENGIKIIVSHRSGETLDDALADYAVGFGADLIKCGIATKWRDVKLRRLIEIENQILKLKSH